MYQIISLETGDIVAICDRPCYIKVKPETGVYVRTTQNEAQGVSAGGIAYNLSGHNEIKSVRLKDEEAGITETVIAPEAIVQLVDGGELVFGQENKIVSNENKINEVDKNAVIGLMAATDLYEQLLSKGVL